MSNEEHYAIVVGINTYPALDNLHAAVNDAEAFYAWLRKPDGGNLPEENIQLLRTTDFSMRDPPVAEHAHPIPNEIDALFQPFVMQGVAGRYGERIYIFVAGHGFSDPQDMDAVALYTANAQKAYPYHVAVTEYADWLWRNAVFDEIILIMDCCRNVYSVHTISKPMLPLGKSPRAATIRHFYAFACGWDKATREMPFDSGTWFGIFTRAVLKALEITRPNEHGEVTGQLLKDQIHNIIHSPQASNIRVDPPEIKLDSHRDIIFFKREAASTTRIQVTVEPHTGQEMLVLSDSKCELCRTRAANPTVPFQLKPGLYKIIVEHTNRKTLFEVPGDEQITV